MAEDLGDRTEDATPKRRAEAREEGNVAKSHDLAGALMLLAVTLGLWAAFMQMLGQGKKLLGETLQFSSLADPLDPAAAGDLAFHIASTAAKLAAPVILIAFGAAFASNFIQIGWVFSPKAAQPTFRKLNPI